MNINTNLSSLITQSSLKRSTLKLNEAIERMTTGCKINHAKDNAANYGIVTNLSSRISSLEVAEDNALMAYDLLSTADSAFELVNSHLRRIRDLAETASNGVYAKQSLEAIQAEIDARMDEINRVIENTEYNDMRLLNAADEARGISLYSDSPADSATSFKELGIISCGFNIYDSSGNIIKNCSCLDTDTLGDFISILNSNGFNAKLQNGTISLNSSSGYYIGGDLADELGITTSATTVVESSTASSTLGVSFTSSSVADGSTTFADLGISDSTFVLKNMNNAAIKTITVKTTDTLDSFITTLGNNTVTAAMTDGVLELSSTAGYTITGELADKLGIEQNISTVISSITRYSNCAYSVKTQPVNNTSVTGIIPGANDFKGGDCSGYGTYIPTDDLTAFADVSETKTLLNGTYSISTTQELVKLATMQNSGKIQRCAFVLANDIDLNGVDWTPIGYSGNQGGFTFRGKFYGNGYVISNLTSSKGGLIFSGDNCEIYDLGISRADINANERFIGGIVGDCVHGIIKNCFVVDSNISSRYYINPAVGGIVGSLFDGTVMDCRISATIAGHSSVGGIVGDGNCLVIRDCYSLGSITARVGRVGGIIGSLGTFGSTISDNSILSNLMSQATITNTLTESSYNKDCGGIGGVIYGVRSVDNVYFRGKLSSSGYASIFGTLRTAESALGALRTTAGSSMINTWQVHANTGSKLCDFGITSGDIAILNSDLTYTTVNIDATQTFQEFFDLLSQHGVKAKFSNTSVLITGTGAEPFKGVSGGSNLYSVFDTFSKNTKLECHNTNSNKLQAGSNQTITTSATLADISGYSNGNGKIGVHKSDGTLAYITLRANDTISVLITKLSNFGINASLSDGKLTLNSNDDVYLQSVSGGSNLLDAFNIGTVSQSKHVSTKNSNSKPLVVNLPSGGDSGDEDEGSTKAPSNGGNLNFGGISGNLDDSISVNLGFDFNLAVDVSTSESARLAIKDIDKVMASIADKQIQIGSAQNRLTSILESISISYENLVSSRSTLQDADIAEVSSDYIKWQILQQASATLMITANQSPSVALGLL